LSGHYQLITTWMSDYGKQPSRYITNAMVNSDFYPYEVSKSSIDLSGCVLVRSPMSGGSNTVRSHMAGDAPWLCDMFLIKSYTQSLTLSTGRLAHAVTLHDLYVETEEKLNRISRSWRSTTDDYTTSVEAQCSAHLLKHQSSSQRVTYQPPPSETHKHRKNRYSQNFIKYSHIIKYSQLF